MSVTNASNKITYVLDGVTSVFAYDFKIFADSEMTATITNVATGAITATLVLTTDFTVSGAGDAGGGNVTLLGNLYSIDEKLVLLREVPYTQEILFKDNEATPKATWAEGYDRAVMLSQQLKEEVDRSIKVNVGATVTPVLPSPVDGNVIVWVGTDGTMTNAPYDSASLDAAIASASASASAASASATAAQTAETNAETAETNAAASAAAAAASAASIDQTKIEDDDANTGWESERTTDDNILYGKTAGTDRIIIDASGRMTMPTQPSFIATKAASQDNIATGGVTAVFDTEISDKGGNFASNTFTAPVAGNYLLTVALKLGTIDSASTNLTVSLVTSNRSYFIVNIEPDIIFSGDSSFHFASSVIADMDANDTVTVVITQTGGAAQMDVNTPSYFMGSLLN